VVSINDFVGNGRRSLQVPVRSATNKGVVRSHNVVVLNSGLNCADTVHEVLCLCRARSNDAIKVWCEYAWGGCQA
jgi:hypothetical protein